MKRGVGALFLAALFSGLAVVQSQVGVLFVTPDENADVPVSGTVQSDFIDMLEEDDQATGKLAINERLRLLFDGRRNIRGSSMTFTRAYIGVVKCDTL